MRMIKRTLTGSVELVARHPTETSGILLFVVAFALVASNAIYFQHQSHPAPLWKASGVQTDDSEVTNVIAKTDTVSSVNSVLAQPISLQNIPVPTARPAIRKSPSTKSSLVREIQQALSELGFYKGKVDGISGSATRQAIIDFETKAKMLPDGTASYKLLERIRVTLAVSKQEQINEPTPTPTPTPIAKPIVEAISSGPEKPNGEPATFLDQTQTTAFDKETVQRIQNGLKTVFGEADIEVDGIYGDQTRQAIMRFQQFFAMDATGKIDQKTMEKLISTGIISAI